MDAVTAVPGLEGGGAPATTPMPDSCQSLLDKVRQLVIGKTRFVASDIQAEAERNEQQAFSVSVKHQVLAQVVSQQISGKFSPANEDVTSDSPFSTVKTDLGRRRYRAAQLLGQNLGRPDVCYTSQGKGSVLATGPCHWHLDTCDKCYGKGRNTCQTCHGATTECCYACSGGGTVTCTEYGCTNGQKNCTICNGMGSVSKLVPYSVQETVWVNGVAHHDYHTAYRNETVTCTAYGCLYGKLTCNRCHGQGRVNCSTCHLTGQITCRTCTGKGHLTCSPCEGSGARGWATRVSVTDTPEYAIRLPEGATATAIGVLEKEGIEGIVALASPLSLHNLKIDNPEPDDVDSALIQAEYASTFPITYLEATCNDQKYLVTAYGPGLEWFSLEGIVEGLLQRDLDALVKAINMAADEGMTASSLDGLLPPLAHVVASELNTDLVEAALDESQQDTHSTVVSQAYAQQLKASVLGSLRFVYTRLALRFWQRATLVAAVTCMLAWVFFGGWATVLAGLLALPVIYHLFNRRVRARLTEVFGNALRAERAERVARLGGRHRIALMIVLGPCVGLVLAALFLLPAMGLWSRFDSTESVASVVQTRNSGSVAVAEALRMREAGERAAAREQLGRLAGAGNHEAFGPYAWMLLNAEGGSTDTPGPEAISQASRLVQQALQKQAGDVWAIAARGYMLLEGYGVPRDAGQGAEHLGRAALQGNVDAMHALGMYYMEDKDKLKNPAAARKWFKLAADAGRAEDMYNLGVLDWYGIGLSAPDRARAKSLWQQAAERGEARAAKTLAQGGLPN